MIGMVRVVTDDRPHCTNGWGGTAERPSCNYTGGHFCELLAGHKGRCRCTCGCPEPEGEREEDDRG
jgi:hypothetical protein